MPILPLLFLCLNTLSFQPRSLAVSASTGSDSSYETLRKVRVVFLLGADCPISRQYLPFIQEIRNTRQAKGLRKVSLVFCNGPAHGHRRIVRAFMKEFGLDMPWRTDPGNRFAHRIEARVVPEVRVFQSGEMVYSGAIDNMFAGLGQRRALTTEHYLLDALEACRMGHLPTQAIRPAYGCLVE